MNNICLWFIINQASFYENGNQKLLTAISLKKRICFQDLQKMLLNSGKVKKFRVFNKLGTEIIEQDDLKYLKDKDILYLSRGQDFDKNNVLAEYQIIKVIGQGGYGKVMLGKHKISKQNVAIKFLKMNNVTGSTDVQSIFKQSQILRSLDHDNIVKVFNCQPLPGMQLYIIMQYLEGGQLLSLLQQRKVTQNQSKIIFKQLVRAMDFCHQRGLIHRDLKLQNLLLASKDRLHIKVVDFGIAGVATRFAAKDIDTGTLKYMAPQIFRQKIKPGPFVDVWSSGIILYALLFGQMPFGGNNQHQLLQSIDKKKKIVSQKLAQKVSKEAVDIVEKCLQKDWKLRPKMWDIIGHPWIQGVDIYDLIHRK